MRTLIYPTLLFILTGCSAALNLDDENCEGEGCPDLSVSGFGDSSASDGDPPADSSVDGTVADASTDATPVDAGRGADASDDASDDAAGDASGDATDAGQPAEDAGPRDTDAVGCIDDDNDGYGEGCAAGPDCRDTSAAVHPGAPERCNAVDDDCDERIDEAFGVGEACSAGVGACLREGSLICGLDGANVECSTSARNPAAEACNELDDDCDGAVDEGVANCCQAGSETPCGQDVGACSAGVQVCGNDGVRGACTGAGPSVEACDDVDNDCDGRTDEMVQNACGACGVVPVEVCNGADDDCDGRADEDTQNACGGCGDTPVEVCNGADDDCDGRTDEGTQNVCGECGAVLAEACDAADNDCDGRVDEGVANACGGCGPVASEVCNGQDDDCNGQSDDVPGAGFPCSAGVGACARPGQTICQGGALGCSAVAGASNNESCNAADDDCDGQTDEGGVCMVCVDEVCNGADDDCDDAIDEGVLNACGICGAVPNEICNGADDDCDGSTDEGVLNACGACGPVPAETCNGRDDNCNGTTDEGFGIGQPCTVGTGECRRTGNVRCSGVRKRAAGGAGAGTECSVSPGPAALEECNGLDDDCDGTTDERVRNACGNCGLAPRELCDELDNDCDNAVDENFDLQTNFQRCGGCNIACNAQRTDRCTAGSCVCGNPGRICRRFESCVNGFCEDGIICEPEDVDCIEP